MVRCLLLAGLMFGLGCADVSAEQIGAAAVSKNDVTGSLGETIRKIGVGDGVSGNEVVKTGTDSATLLKFLDSSNLNIGASSTIVLDKFVYNPDKSADTVVFGLTKGALRFVSGHSDPTKFVVKTQVATLGVRGTDFVALCDGSGRCAIVVAKGKVRVCPHPNLLPISCPDSYELDAVKNLTTVGLNGVHTQPTVAGKALVDALLHAVATGRNGLTVASVESGSLGKPGSITVPSVGSPRSASAQ